MAVNDFALCTLGDIKRNLNIETTNATRDNWIEDKIEEVSDEIEEMTHRKFVGRIYDERYDGDGSGSFFTDQVPVNSIVTLLDDTYREWDNPAVDVIEKDDVMIYRDRGKIQLWNDESSFDMPDGGQNIRIEYHAGFSLLDINLNRNDWIDFVYGSTSTSAQVPRDEYDCYALASRLKYEMNQAVGATIIDTEFNGKTNRFRISLNTSGYQTLQLQFSGGNNSAYSISTTLGFGQADYTGTTRYSPSTSCSPHIPQNIRRLAVNLVSEMYRDSEYGSGRAGIDRERMGEYAITYLHNAIEENASIRRTISYYTRTSRTIL